MTENIAKQFVEALHRLELERDLETIVSLFSENAEIGNVVTENKDIGVEEFWKNYRGTFDKVESTFRNEIFADGTAALEWTTTGTTSAGQSFEYDGVSILEIDADKIKRFHAYFDPNKLGKQIVSDEQAEATSND